MKPVLRNAAWSCLNILSNCLQTHIKHVDLNVCSLFPFFFQGERFHVRPLVFHSFVALSSDTVSDFWAFDRDTSCLTLSCLFTGHDASYRALFSCAVDFNSLILFQGAAIMPGWGFWHWLFGSVGWCVVWSSEWMELLNATWLQGHNTRWEA